MNHLKMFFVVVLVTCSALVPQAYAATLPELTISNSKGNMTTLAEKEELDFYYITMRCATEGGAITSEKGMASSVEKGKELKILLSPYEGYEIEKVLVDNKAIDLKELVYEKNNPNATSEDGVAIYTFKNVNGDHTINVYYRTKETSVYYITMSCATEGGAITSEKGMASSVEKGKELKILLSPDEGYEVEKVLVDNKAIDLKELVYEKNNPNAASEDGVAIYTFKNVNGDHTINVYYRAKETSVYYITMRCATEGGAITSEKGMASSVEKGKELKILLSPDEGYEVEKVLVDNKAIDLKELVYEKNNPNAASEDGVAIYTFKNVNSDHTIRVYYRAKETSVYYITMRCATEGGAITSEKGMASSVEKGKELKILLSPYEGYEIEKVLVDNKAIDLKELVYEKNNPNAASEDGVAIYTFKNVNSDHTIRVYYRTKETSVYYITMRCATEGGAITSEKGMASSVEKGKELKILLSPYEGYEIEKVLVDNKAIDLKELVYEKNNPNAASEDGVAIYTFKNVNGDHTINVYYRAKETSVYYITMRCATEGGAITSEKGMASSVEKGKELKILLSPDEGYEVEKVLVDNKAIDLKELFYEKNNPNAASEDGVAIYTFKNVNSDHTIRVYYRAKETSVYYITMSCATEGGAITSEKGMASSVEKGKELKILLSPYEGYEIEKVLVDNKAIDLKELVYEKNNPNATSEDGVAIYTFKNVNSDHTINVYYKVKNTHTNTPWINVSDWAAEELNKANILSITPDVFNKQDLTQNITRRESAHVTVKLYEKLTGSKAIAIENNPFKDTDDIEVLKAYNLGITQGTGADTFTPDALITREQLVTMVTRALTKAGIDTKVDLEKVNKFADDGEMHDWGKASIYYMSSIEIIKGVGNNTFNVLGNATREQALLISGKSVEKFAK